MNEPTTISGEIFEDHRGQVRFVNEFDMGEVVRFYEIRPVDTKIARGWQGHQLEKKWFYCNAGSLIVNVVPLDDFENPSVNSQVSKFVIGNQKPEILCVPGGYATAFKANEENTKIQVFSNFTLAESKKDDFRFPLTQWSTNWNL